MTTTGLLFSGQGAQHVGMGRSLYENVPEARSVFERADDVLGWGLREICFEGPEDKLTETKVCQPALYVHGCAAHAALRAQGGEGRPGVAFGLSLGELTAHAAAGTYDFDTGLRLVAERGRLMQEACEASEGGMASLIGGSRGAADDLCRRFDLEIANLNCPGQIVVSGNLPRIREIAGLGKDSGFKMIKPLNVAGAYHSRLMRTARDKFEEFIRDFEFQSPQLPVYSNTTGQLVREPEEIRRALVEQIVSPVHFEDCLRHAATEQNVDTFYEFGPGGVLAGLAKRTDKSLRVTRVAEFEDLPAETA